MAMELEKESPNVMPESHVSEQDVAWLKLGILGQ